MRIFLDYESNYRTVSEEISFKDFFNGEDHRYKTLPIEKSIEALKLGFIGLVDRLFENGSLTPEDIPYLVDGWGTITKIEKDTP